MGDAHTAYPKGLGDGDGIHFAREIDAQVALAVVQLLEHLDPSKAAVVEQDDGDGQAQAGNGRQFHARHAERAIPHQADDALGRPGECRADRRGESIAQPAVSGVIVPGSATTTTSPGVRRHRVSITRWGASGISAHAARSATSDQKGAARSASVWGVHWRAGVLIARLLTISRNAASDSFRSPQAARDTGTLFPSSVGSTSSWSTVTAFPGEGISPLRVTSELTFVPRYQMQSASASNWL